MEKQPAPLPPPVRDVIKTSIKYFLMMSFLLAFLPGGNKHHHDYTKKKLFAVVVDHVQSLAPTENNKRFENETEDPHPLAVYESSVPAPAPQAILYSAFSLQLHTTAYYPIRAPPANA
ncbi:MAG: hypothetical protein NVV73_18690 [Cellvibrionaceae bacterium]|nr:hypothetical protein [Cellvibrionaceae bacterium]